MDAEELRSAGLPSGWMDLWLDHVQHQDKTSDIAESFTFDGKKNTLIDNRNFQSRLDRMFYRNNNVGQANVSPRVSFRRIGLEPMAMNNGHASDHFGILTELNIPFDLETAEEQRFKSRKRQRTESNGTRDNPILI